LEFEIGRAATGSGKTWWAVLEVWRNGKWERYVGTVNWTRISSRKRIGVISVAASEFEEGTVLRYTLKPYRGRIVHYYYIVEGGEIREAGMEEVEKKVEIEGVEVTAVGARIPGKIEDIWYYIVPQMGIAYDIEAARKAVKELKERYRERIERVNKAKPLLAKLVDRIPEWADALNVSVHTFIESIYVTIRPVKKSKYGDKYYSKMHWSERDLEPDIADRLREIGLMEAIVLKTGEVMPVVSRDSGNYIIYEPVRKTSQ